MTAALYSDRVIFADGIRPAWIGIEGDRIVSIGEKPKNANKYYDFGRKYLSPGLIDLHTHGGGGHAFINSSADEVAAGCRFHLAHGTTTILPTVSAAPLDRMRAATEHIAAAMRGGERLPRIPGAHLEGPYLSSRQAGAQCADYITPPRPADYERLVDDLGRAIARWTYAPENDPDGRFCAFLSAHGILPSAGHTDAVYADMERAIAAGCRLVTHLYSCTSTVTRDHGFRSPGVIESAFLRDELFVEIIADGKHLPPALIRMIVKIKGPERVALVTDSLAIAGTAITSGEMSGTPFIVEDGVCKLTDRSAFAGSVATGDRLIRVMTEECGFSLTEAIAMAARTPARILGLEAGEIRAGYAADLIVFDDGVRVSDVFVGGEKIEIPQADPPAAKGASI